jgi:glutathione peroxidase
MDQSIYGIPVHRISGEEARLDDYRGQVVLIVNVASKCGLTPQYEALEKLHEQYRDQGFSVLGFPANDFGAQEPGSNEEIQSFCTGTYGVQFPMFAKIAVTGEQKHPLYQRLTSAMPDVAGREKMEGNLRKYKIEPTAAPEVLWNFEKFLVGRDGRVIARFSPDTAPDAPAVRQAIEQALAA